MALLHNLGFPRIGTNRELKCALEAFWDDRISTTQLLQQATDIRLQNWRQQQPLDWIPVGDFSLYDQVLDMSFCLGNVPIRISTQDNRRFMT